MKNRLFFLCVIIALLSANLVAQSDDACFQNEPTVEDVCQYLNDKIEGQFNPTSAESVAYLNEAESIKECYADCESYMVSEKIVVNSITSFSVTKRMNIFDAADEIADQIYYGKDYKGRHYHLSYSNALVSITGSPCPIVIGFSHEYDDSLRAGIPIHAVMKNSSYAWERGSDWSIGGIEATSSPSFLPIKPPHL